MSTPTTFLLQTAESLNQPGLFMGVRREDAPGPLGQGAGLISTGGVVNPTLGNEISRQCRAKGARCGRSRKPVIKVESILQEKETAVSAGVHVDRIGKHFTRFVMIG